MIKLALILLTGFCIATGQALLSRLARGFNAPHNVMDVLVYALTSASLWLAAIVYLIGVAAYMLLLRWYPLAEVTLTIMAVLVALTLAYTAALGQTMQALQWVGAIVVGIGLLLLHLRT